MCRNFSIKWVENVIKLSVIEKQKSSPMLFSGARSVNECAPSLSAWWALVLLSPDLSCAPTETKTSARKRLSRQRFWILPLLSLAESKLQYWLKAAQARAAAAQLYFLEIKRLLLSDSTPVNFSKESNSRQYFHKLIWQSVGELVTKVCTFLIQVALQISSILQRPPAGASPKQVRELLWQFLRL